MLVGVPGQAGLLAPLVHRELQQGLPEAADRGGGHLRLRPHLQPLRHDRVCGLSPPLHQARHSLAEAEVAVAMSS